MALFKKLFNSENSNSHNKEFNWINFTSEDQMNSILEDSHRQPQLIFKHSTRCFTSSMAKKEFEKMYSQNESLNFYFINVIADRSLSNMVAETFNVRHESPQLLVVKDGKVDIHASHSDIVNIPLQMA